MGLLACSTLGARSSDQRLETTGFARLELAQTSIHKLSQKKLRVSPIFHPKSQFWSSNHPNLSQQMFRGLYTLKGTQRYTKLEIKTSFHHNTTIQPNFTKRSTTTTIHITNPPTLIPNALIHQQHIPKQQQHLIMKSHTI